MNGPARWLLLAGAGVVVALTAATDGPLGAWPLLGRHAHRAADWLAAALLAASPLAPGRDAVSILVLEVGAVLLWRLTGLTRYEAPARAAGAGAAPSGPAEARPTGRAAVSDAEPAEAGPTGRAAVSDAGTTAVRPAGTAGRPAGPSPELERAVRRNARKAGLAAGILQRRARAARRQT